MRLRRLPLIITVFLLLALSLSGCGSSQAGESPSAKESSAVRAKEQAKPSKESKPVAAVSDSLTAKEIWEIISPYSI